MATARKKGTRKRKVKKKEIFPNIFGTLFKGGRRDYGIAFILLGLAGLLWIPDPIDIAMILGGGYLFVTSKEVWGFLRKKVKILS